MAAGSHRSGRDDRMPGPLPARRQARMSRGKGAGRPLPVDPVRFSIEVLLLDQVVGDVIDDLSGGPELLLEHLRNLCQQEEPVDVSDVGGGAHGVEVTPSDVRVGRHEDELSIGRPLPALCLELVQKFAGHLVAQPATAGVNHHPDPVSYTKRLRKLGLLQGDGLDFNKVISAADAPHRLDPPLAGAGTELRLRIEIDTLEAVADIGWITLPPPPEDALKAGFSNPGDRPVPAQRHPPPHRLNYPPPNPPGRK